MADLTDCLCNGMDENCPLCKGQGKYPDCTLCGGLGRVQRTVATNDGVEYAGSSCPKCGHRDPRQVKRMTGMTQEMFRWTFGRMTQDYPSLITAANAIRQIVDDGRGWIVLLTPPGRGKSWLMAAAMNRAIKAGRRCYYSVFNSLMAELTDNIMGKSANTYRSALRRLTALHLLCVDEFGVEGGTSDFQARTIRELLGARSDTGGWLPTIISSNARLSEIAAKWDWLEDRFWDKEVQMFDLSDVPSLRGVL